MREFEQIKSQAEQVWGEWRDPNRTKVIVGIATCSLASGAGASYEAIQRELEASGIRAELGITGCVGTCYLEPLVDIYKPGRPPLRYGNVTEALAPQLVRDVLAGDLLRTDLLVGTLTNEPYEGIPSFWSLDFFKPQQRQLTRRCGETDPENIDHYLATGGYTAFVKAITEMTPEQVIEEVKKSKITGRGGAAYPTGLKWEQCRKASGYPKYMICNADEGVPGAFVDRILLEGDPHAILEGMLIAAYAVGSDQGFIYIRAEYPLAAERFAKAIQQAQERGLLGKNILGTGMNFQVQIRRGAGSYVAGESSAQMSSIEGLRAMPRLKRPRSVEKGLWAKPTSMNNVETFANIPHIVLNGGDWYASIGTGKSTGTKLFSISGHIRYTGVLEVPFGTTTRAIVDAAGGAQDAHQLKMAQFDGPAGGILPASLFDTPIDLEEYAKVTVPVGSGGLVIMDERVCVVDLLRYCLDFNCEESCDRCTTCRLGTQRMKIMFERLATGQGEPGDLQIIEQLAHVMKRNSQCGLGQAAPNPVFSVLRYFREELETHIKEKRCPSHQCEELIEYRIDLARCTLCMQCVPACPVGAIEGQQVLSIRQEVCIKCDICVETCPEGAIPVVDRPRESIPVGRRRLAPALAAG